MEISFEGIGKKVITVARQNAVQKGSLVFFTSDKTVAVAPQGAAFSGKVIEVYDDGSAAVQIGGYLEVPYTDASSANYLDLQGLSSTDGKSVHKDANGRKYMVIHIDTAKRIVGIIL